MLFAISMLGGYAFILSLQQQHIRYKIEKLASTDILPLTAFRDIDNNKEVKWVDNKKEFYYKGVRYDVIKQVCINGFKITLSYADEEETEIVVKIKHAATNGIEDKSPLHKPLTQMMGLLSLYFLPAEGVRIPPVIHGSLHVFTYAYRYPDYLKLTLDIPLPPPKRLFV